MIQQEIDKIKKEINSIEIENQENFKRLNDLQNEIQKLELELFKTELQCLIWKFSCIEFKNSNIFTELSAQSNKIYNSFTEGSLKYSEKISFYQRDSKKIEIIFYNIDSFFEFISTFNLKIEYNEIFEKITKFYNDFNERLKEINLKELNK